MAQAKSVTVGISVAVTLLLVAGGWYATRENRTESVSIEIGTLIPLTGKFASYGEDIRNGIILAQEELSGRGVELSAVHEDSGAEPKLSLSGARKLIEIDAVSLVIGGPGSSGNLSVAPIFEEEHVLFFPISSTPKLNDAGRYIFKIHPDVEYEVERMVKFVSEQGLRRVAIFYDSASDTNTGAANLFKAENEKAGGSTPLFDGFDSKTVTDFRARLSALKASTAEGIYLMASEVPSGILVRQARELGITLPIFGWSATNGEEFFRGAGAFADGVVITDQPFSCEGSEQARAFCRTYIDRFSGRVPRQYAAHAYDLTVLIAEAFSESDIEGPELNDSEKEKLIAYFSNRTFDGVSGKLAFDANGNIRDKDFVFRIAKDGKFVDLK